MTLYFHGTRCQKKAQRCILIQYRSVTSNEPLEVIKLYMISNIGQSFVKRTCETKVPRFYLFGLGIQSLNFLFMYYQSFLSDIIFSKCNCVHNVWSFKRYKVLCTKALYWSRLFNLWIFFSRFVVTTELIPYTNVAL